MVLVCRPGVHVRSPLSTPHLVCTEHTCPYKQVANAIFRMGGAAVLMTNKPSMAKHSKYQLDHCVRVHTGQDDTAYRCVCVFGGGVLLTDWLMFCVFPLYVYG
jgi:FAE1/Type III polyketide synthase-like protein